VVRNSTVPADNEIAPSRPRLLRETRRRSAAEQWVSLSGPDPLNLFGVLTPAPGWLH
jgi:hypothetical protein